MAIADSLRSSQPSLYSHTMRYSLCNLYSISPKHGEAMQSSSEQWGTRREHQRVASNMFRKSKIKQQNSLEQKRLFKASSPG
jgi:hypothetical protein